MYDKINKHSHRLFYTRGLWHKILATVSTDRCEQGRVVCFLDEAHQTFINQQQVYTPQTLSAHWTDVTKFDVKIIHGGSQIIHQSVLSLRTPFQE